jgi:hypothetical protein
MATNVRSRDEHNMAALRWPLQLPRKRRSSLCALLASVGVTLAMAPLAAHAGPGPNDASDSIAPSRGPFGWLTQRGRATITLPDGSILPAPDPKDAIRLMVSAPTSAAVGSVFRQTVTVSRKTNKLVAFAVTATPGQFIRLKDSSPHMVKRKDVSNGDPKARLAVVSHPFGRKAGGPLKEKLVFSFRAPSVPTECVKGEPVLREDFGLSSSQVPTVTFVGLRSSDPTAQAQLLAGCKR